MTLRIIARRAATTALTILAVVTLVFLMMRILPGDPVEAMLVEAGAPAAMVDEWRERYGLDRSLAAQYVIYLGSLASGDLGDSIYYRRPVVSLISEQFPSTAALAATSFALALLLGGAMGLAGALRRGSTLDSLVRLLAVTSVSLPTYWTGILAILLFGAGLKWLPSGGTGTWHHLVLPTLTLGLASAGVIARLTRSTILEVTAQAHVQVALSKGLPSGLLVRRHVLRNAAPTVVTMLGLQMGFLLAGTAITETIFSRPGVGRLLVEAVVTKDYPLAQGCIIFVALTYTMANALSDTAASFLDPRVREP